MEASETVFCHYCRREIYYGPRERKYKEDTYATTETWRHVHSDAAACDMVYATPVQEQSTTEGV